METKEYRPRSYSQAVEECKALMEVREYLNKVMNDVKNRKPAVDLTL